MLTSKNEIKRMADMAPPMRKTSRHFVKSAVREMGKIGTGIIFCVALCTIPVKAATVTWDGTDGTDWATGENWDTGYAPGTSTADQVYFQGTPTAYQPMLTANAPAGTGTITLLQFDSAGWTVGGTGKKLTIKNAANGNRVVSNGTGTNTIEANIEFTNSYIPTFVVGADNKLITTGNVTWASSSTTLAKSGSGTWTVRGTLYSSGVKVSGGTMELDRASGFAINDNVPITVSGSSSVLKWLRNSQMNPGAYLRMDSGGTVDLNGFNQTALYLQAGRDSTNANGTVSTGAGVLTLSSTSANGVVRYGYDDGVLQSGLSGTLTINGNVVLNGAGVKNWDITDSTTTGVEVRVNAALSGTGGVTQQGTGTLELNASNSYSGNTVIDKATIGSTTYNAGTLIVNGAATESSSATGTGSVSVGATGTLAGIGTVGQTGRTGTTLSVIGTDASNLAAVAPGNPTVSDTVGVLEVNGDVSLGTYSKLKMELKSGGVSDQLGVTGAFSINGTGTVLTIDLLSGQTLSGTYTLASYGSFSGAFSAVYYNGVLIANPMSESAIGGTHQLVYTSDALLLTVPEPGMVTLYLTGIALTGLRLRKVLRRLRAEA